MFAVTPAPYETQGYHLDQIARIRREVARLALEAALAVVREVPDATENGPREASWALAQAENAIRALIAEVQK